LIEVIDMEWNNFKFIDLFAGIGGMRLGFEAVGGKCVYSSEWDEYAQNTYELNFGERPEGDITQIPPESIPDHDILLAGFPCQAFSICGDMKGFSDTRGTLFFYIEKILAIKKPYCFLLENVKQLISHNEGHTLKTIIQHLENLDYFVQQTVLNSLNFGIPQKRERVFIVGFKDDIEFEFPKPLPYKTNLENILEKDEQIDKKYFVSKEIQKKRKLKVKGVPPIPSIWHENKGGNISALEYSCALRATASYNYLLVNGIRRLTPREMLRFQGFPETFKITESYTQTKKLVGNSVSVPVIKEIAKAMIRALKSKKQKVKTTQMSLFK